MSVSSITSETANASAESSVGVSLAKRISAGDVAAENELVRHFERGVRLILVRATGDIELARDLSQDTFVIVLKRLRSEPLEDPTRLAGFIAQTARNLAIAEKRRGSRRRTETNPDEIEAAADDAPSREQQSEAESAAIAVRKLLQGLKSTRDRAAIVRYYLDEASKETVCAELGLTELQFNLVLFRARDRLRQMFQQGGFAKSDLLSLVFL